MQNEMGGLYRCPQNEVMAAQLSLVSGETHPEQFDHPVAILVPGLAQPEQYMQVLIFPPVCKAHPA